MASLLDSRRSGREVEPEPGSIAVAARRRRVVTRPAHALLAGDGGGRPYRICAHRQVESGMSAPVVSGRSTAWATPVAGSACCAHGQGRFPAPWRRISVVRMDRSVARMNPRWRQGVRAAHAGRTRAASTTPELRPAGRRLHTTPTEAAGAGRTSQGPITCHCQDSLRSDQCRGVCAALDPLDALRRPATCRGAPRADTALPAPPRPPPRRSPHGYTPVKLGGLRPL